MASPQRGDNATLSEPDDAVPGQSLDGNHIMASVPKRKKQDKRLKRYCVLILVLLILLLYVSSKQNNKIDEKKPRHLPLQLLGLLILILILPLYFFF